VREALLRWVTGTFNGVEGLPLLPADDEWLVEVEVEELEPVPEAMLPPAAASAAASASGSAAAGVLTADGEGGGGEHRASMNGSSDAMHATGSGPVVDTLPPGTTNSNPLHALNRSGSTPAGGGTPSASPPSGGPPGGGSSGSSSGGAPFRGGAAVSTGHAGSAAIGGAAPPAPGLVIAAPHHAEPTMTPPRGARGSPRSVAGQEVTLVTRLPDDATPPAGDIAPAPHSTASVRSAGGGRVVATVTDDTGAMRSMRAGSAGHAHAAAATYNISVQVSVQPGGPGTATLPVTVSLPVTLDTRGGVVRYPAPGYVDTTDSRDEVCGDDGLPIKAAAGGAAAAAMDGAGSGSYGADEPSAYVS